MNLYKLLWLGVIIGVLVLTPVLSHSQTLQNGCEAASFGIDADVYSNISDHGNNAGFGENTDDWFNGRASLGYGIGVIDTTNAWMMRNVYMSGSNVPFSLKGSQPNNSIINGVRWLDATYIRDFYGGPGNTDITSYTSASKNGEDPAIWATGPQNVTPKNDLIDSYVHMRRDGSTINDDLWIMLGFSRVSNTGDSYFDAEIYALPINYDEVANTFGSAGDEEGHTAWEFDSAGNIVGVGDLIITASMSTTSAPEFEVRVWVSRDDYNNVNPATFDFGAEFDGAANSSQYGYADIVPPTGNGFGCALGNPDFSEAPPWGTLDPGGDFSDVYHNNQFLEMGLNLTEFGIDVAIVNDGNSCELPFSNVVFKTRASNSFTAQLKDFSGPYPFVAISYAPAEIIGENISCAYPEATLQADSLVTNAFYHWTTPNGNITSDPFAESITVDEPGMYILTASPIQGCTGVMDTFIVEADTIPPDAYITADPIYGCDNVLAHLVAGENGMEYFWTGPNGYSSTLQEVDVTEPGWYYLEVTRPSNGCTAYDTIYVIQYPCADEGPDGAVTTVIIDDDPPTFTVPSDITIDCEADYTDLTLTGDVLDEYDSCDPGIGEAVSTDVLITDGLCDGELIVERTWTLTDACGNITVLVQNIYLQDTTPPTFEQPADITLDCSTDIDDLNITGNTSNAADNCDPNLDIAVYTDVVIPNSPCNGSSIVNRTWSITDDCGNTAIELQVITLVDTTPPSFIAPPDVTINCNQNPDILVLTGDATEEADDCSTNIGEATYSDNYFTDTPCEGAGYIERTWYLSDDCGNDTSIVQIITLEDNKAPTFTPPSDVTISCEDDPDDLNITGEISDESDNCYQFVGLLEYEDEFITANYCDGSSKINRTWTLTDACGNASSRVQEITIVDNIVPSFTTPADITLDCSQDPNDLNLTGDATGETDGCQSVTGEATYTDVIEENTPCNGSTRIVRTWMLADDCGNVFSQDQIIILEDTTPPVFDLPEDITISCDLDPEDLLITGTTTNVSDDCDSNIGTPTYTDVISGTPACEHTFTIERTWTLSDACGNINSMVQTIEVIDTIAPIFTSPENVTLYLDDDCQVNTDSAVIGAPTVVSDACANDFQVSYTDDASGLTECSETGTIIRTWSVADACGNVRISEQIITLVDTIAPQYVLPEDAVVYISAQCTLDTTVSDLGGIDLTNDNCGADILVSYTDNFDGLTGCNGTGTFSRTWTVTDPCGNVASGIQSITVIDTISPTFTPPADTEIFLDVQCGFDLSTTDITITDATDNCPADVEITYSDDLQGLTGCNNTGTVVRTWTVTDECGNVATGTQNIIVRDTITPTFELPNDATVYFEPGCSLDTTIANTGAPVSSDDNCTATLNISYVDELDGLTECNGTGTFVRTWIVADDCGNMATGEQIITVLDTIAPTFTTPTDATVYIDAQCLLDTSIIATGGVVDANDNCTNDLTVTYTDDFAGLSGCNSTGSFIRTWTVSDACGNFTNGEQLITVVDSIAPTYNTPDDITVYLDNSCGLDTTTNNTGEVTGVADNCGNTVDVQYVDDFSGLAECNNTGTLIRTWTISDVCGNTSSFEQMITVLDTIQPTFSIPSDTIIYLDGTCGLDLSLTTIGGASNINDNCSNDPLVNYTDDFSGLTECNNTGTVIRTWTITDDCGNSFTGEQSITVQDTITPTLSVPTDVTVYFDNACSLDTSAISTGVATTGGDNCTPNVTTSYVDDLTGLGGCNSTGTFVRTWIVSDECGNSVSGEQFITVMDTIAPTFSVPSDATVYIDAQCNLDTSIIAIGGVVDAVDNCSNDVLVTYIDDFAGLTGCNNSGSFIRTWTVSDACGNETIGEQLITVLDTIAPTYTTPDDVTLYLDVNCEMDTSITNIGAVTDIIDNCGNAVDVQYVDDFTGLTECNNTGVLIRVWTISDLCGNTSQHEQFIMVLDTIQPGFVIPSDTIVYLDETCGLDLSLATVGGANAVNDNCTSDPTVNYADDFSGLNDCNNTGTILRTWTISDECGNSVEGVQTITVQDTITPSLDIPADATVYFDLSCGLDTTTANTGVATTGGDNCTANVTTTYTDDFSGLSGCNNTGTFVRIWMVSDECGNSISGEQLITVADTIAPTFTTPSDATVYVDVQCALDTSVLAIGGVVDATDNCDNNLTVSYVDDFTGLVGCNSTGSFTRTWTVIDDCGNLSEGTQLVNVVDTLAPTFTMPDDLTVFLDSSCGLDTTSTSTGVVTDVQDNCGNPVTIEYTDDFSGLGECNGSGVLLRVWELTDVCGNIATGVQTITVLDTIAPSVIFPVDTTLYVDINCLIDTSTNSIGSVSVISDNCPTDFTIVYNDDLNGLTDCNGTGTFERSWIVSDACGNTVSGSQFITLIDTIAPQFTAPEDITLYLDESCTYDASTSLTGNVDFPTDNCDGAVVVTYNDVVDGENNCGSSAVISRTWILVDACGNTSIDIQTIEILDTINPVFTLPVDITITCEEDPNDLLIVGEPSAVWDNCGSTGSITYADSVVVDDNCAANTWVYRTWSIADSCGNVANGLQVITVVDTIAPSFTLPDDVTITCDQDITDLAFTGMVTNEADGCTPLNGTATYADSMFVGGDCQSSTYFIRTWTLSDACGNVQTGMQTITLLDTIAPVFTVPADITLACDTDITDLTFTGDVTDEVDGCASSVGEASYTDIVEVDPDCANNISIYRTWSLADGCGNIMSDTQVISLIDTVAPTFDIPEDITLQCGQDPNDLVITGTANNVFDNCTSNPGTVDFSDSTVVDPGCPNGQVITRTWFLADACGNTTEQIQTITVIDTIAPVISGVFIDTTITCGQVPEVVAPQVSDICSADVILELTTDSISNGCPGNYTIQRIWTATDECANVTIFTQEINVEDITPPVFLNEPAHATVVCGAIPDPDLVEATDECGGEVTIDFDEAIYDGDCADSYLIIRTWVASDLCGNTATTVQNITVQDNELPEFLSFPQDITVDCDSIPAVEDPEAIDNCDSDVTVNFEETSNPGICIDSYTISRVWTAVDNCGNETTITQEITVIGCGPEAESMVGPDNTVCELEPVSFEVTITSGYTTPVYQWQYSADGQEWSNIFGAIISTLQISQATAQDAGWYRCLVSNDPSTLTDPFCNVISNEAQLIVISPIAPTQLEETICTGDSLLFAGNVISDEGIYYDTLSSVLGCDSIVALQLNILPFYEETVPVSICEGDAYQGVFYTADTSLVDSLLSINGCDSIVHTNITVNPEYFQTLTVDLCSGDAYQGINYFSDTTWTVTYSSIAGCDSIHETQIIVAPEVLVNFTDTICFGDTYEFGVQNITNPGSYTESFTGVNGCDSTVVLSLVVLDNDLTNVTVDLCVGELFEGQLFSGDTLLVDSLINANGCDSIVNTFIDYHDPVIESQEVQLCFGQAYQGIVYTSDTTFIDSLQTSFGCDSIVQRNLTLINDFTDTIRVDLCYGELYSGVSYFADSTWTNQYTSVAGCDSLETTIIQVALLQDTMLSDTICAGDEVVIGGNTYSATGTYTETLTGVNGCDSTVVLNLLVVDPDQVNITVDLCVGELFEGQVFGGDTLLIDSLVNIYGCDSIVNTFIDYHDPVIQDQEVQLCFGQAYQGVVYTSDTTFVDSLQTVYGCDSIVNRSLTLINDFTDTIRVDLCYGQPYDGINYFSDTTWTNQFVSMAGCDSLETTIVQVALPQDTILSDTICAGNEVVIGGNTYSATGTYTETLTGVNGCDSTVVFNLLVLDAGQINITVDLCVGELFEGQLFSGDTLLIDSLINANGCDSIVNTFIDYHDPVVQDQNVELCLGQAYQGIIYTTDTTFVDSLQTIFGCDSIVTTNLFLIDNFTDTIQVDLCYGDLYAGIPYFADSTWTNQYASTAGCDSLETIIVQIALPQDTLLRDTICSGQQVTIGSNVYNTTGTYTEVLVGENGCDSTVTFELLVIDAFEFFEVDHVCYGDSLNGVVYYQDSIWVDSLLSQAGCDSLRNYAVIVHEPTIEQNDIQLCLGQAFEGIVYESDTLWTDSLQSTYGCDSIVVTNIQLIESFNDTIVIDLCSGDNYMGTTYFDDASWANAYVSSTGCDSIVVTYLSVHPVSSQDSLVVLCPGDGIWVNGNFETSEGVYSEVYTNEFGCDSIWNIELQLLDIVSTVENITICPGDTAMIFGNPETVAGTYTQTLTGQNTCDSLITINLNIYQSEPAFTNAYVCPGDSLWFNDSYISDPGVYSDTIAIGSSCDSIVFLTLDYHPEYELDRNFAFCEGDSIFVAGDWQSETGVYTDTLQTQYGCDSIVHYSIIVSPAYDFYRDTVICEGDAIFAGGAWQTSSGVFTDEYTTTAGCDSVYVTELTVLPATDTSWMVTICEGDSYYFAGADQVASGTYTEQYINSFGCDSLITVELTVIPSEQTPMELMVCAGDSILIYDNYQTDAGFYYDTLQTVSGCDSILVTELTLGGDIVESFQEFTMCEGDSIWLDGAYQFESGQFVEHFDADNACDSVVITELLVYEQLWLEGDGAVICEGEEVQLFLTGSETVEVSWFPTTDLSCEDCLDPIASPSETTTYTVSYQGLCDDGIEVMEVTVVVEPRPLLEVESDVESVFGDSVTLAASVNDTSAIINWYDMDGNLLCNGCSNIDVMPQTTTSYYVTAENGLGCPDEDVITLRVQEGCEFGTVEVNNVIFPQSGGYGDHWEIWYENVDVHTIRVFNRWGEKVFETNDPSIKWDGTFRGEVLNPGVYVYYILGNCRGDGSEPFMKVGNVTLIH